MSIYGTPATDQRRRARMAVLLLVLLTVGFLSVLVGAFLLTLALTGDPGASFGALLLAGGAAAVYIAVRADVL